ncbi:MAG: phosphotransferase [Candidatus Melainabacteria bacterium]|nr:phosphotransferase [Candidatus Melainabacteria bacterium]MBX9674696.1 phosphotransferase [Candidatus Obscuribacterales bacterium]
MSNQLSNDPSLDLLPPAPDAKLTAWLTEFYGKPVEVQSRELLRHRDLSRVERLVLHDALPASLIYKQVLPPWEIEQDLHERILVPSISNSPQLFMAAHHGQVTAMFMEDLGKDSLIDHAVGPFVAKKIGAELAKMHRSYSYRTDELLQLNILRSLSPIDYEAYAREIATSLDGWGLIDRTKARSLRSLAQAAARALAGEPTSLIHGDLYAENIVLRGSRIFYIDWSWFTMLSAPILDLATITCDHHKNGSFTQHRNLVLESYCFESGRDEQDTRSALPYAEALNRLIFLAWLVERKSRGIEGTTVGPVDDLIGKVVDELCQKAATLKS